MLVNDIKFLKGESKMNWAKIDKYNEERGRKFSFTGAELTQEYLELLSERAAGTDSRGIKWGNDEIDGRVRTERGDFIVYADKYADLPKHFTMEAVYLAMQGYKTAVFVNRWSAYTTAANVLSELSRIPEKAITSDEFTEEKWRLFVSDGVEVLETVPITFHFGRWTSDEIADAVMEDGADAIFIDDIDAVSDYDGYPSEDDRHYAIARDLFRLSRTLDVLVETAVQMPDIPDEDYAKMFLDIEILGELADIVLIPDYKSDFKYAYPIKSRRGFLE